MIMTCPTLDILSNLMFSRMKLSLILKHLKLTPDAVGYLKRKRGLVRQHSSCVPIPQTRVLCLALTSGGLPLQRRGWNLNGSERLVWCEGKLRFPFIGWAAFSPGAVFLASSLQTACSLSQSATAVVKHTTCDEKSPQRCESSELKGKMFFSGPGLGLGGSTYEWGACVYSIWRLVNAVAQKHRSLSNGNASESVFGFEGIKWKPINALRPWDTNITVDAIFSSRAL